MTSGLAGVPGMGYGPRVANTTVMTIGQVLATSAHSAAGKAQRYRKRKRQKGATPPKNAASGRPCHGTPLSSGLRVRRDGSQSYGTEAIP